MHEDRNAIAQLIIYEPPPKDRSHTGELVELDVPVSQLRTSGAWRQDLREALERAGDVKVLAINELRRHVEGPNRHEVVVTVQARSSDRLRRLKPVTRGGRPIEGPVPVRTIAARKRGR